MIPAQLAIARFNRDLTLGRVLNFTLLAGVILAILFGAAINTHMGDVLLVILIGAVWMGLGYQSIRGSRLAAGSSTLIATGQFDLAEQQIETALRTFSLFRGAKMMSLHHLAVLRHAQRRWGDAVELCRALLRQRLGALNGLARQSRLILADALLEIGDLRGAHDAITSLYRERLTLAEALSLLSVQLDYLWRINAFDTMVQGIAQKVQLTELASTHNSARMQALLALAAARVGRSDWEEYLRRRVELLSDVDQLIKERPVLHELYRASEKAGEKSGSVGEMSVQKPDGSAQPPSQEQV
jgi:hypothetical protein